MPDIVSYEYTIENDPGNATKLSWSIPEWVAWRSEGPTMTISSASHVGDRPFDEVPFCFKFYGVDIEVGASPNPIMTYELEG